MAVEDTTEYQVEAPRDVKCPKCGREIEFHRTPYSTWIACDVDTGKAHRCRAREYE